MYKTFLLRTFDRIISRVEIRHQHSSEPSQQLLNRFALTALSEKVYNIGQVCQNPNVSWVALYVGTGLVCVNYSSGDDAIQDLCSGIAINSRCPIGKFRIIRSQHN